MLHEQTKGSKFREQTAPTPTPTPPSPTITSTPSRDSSDVPNRGTHFALNAAWSSVDTGEAVEQAGIACTT